ncbi:MAG: hypothetical protein IPO83_16530 [Chitinophagaceae bacterium]|nr:hypothetical protein [Chitinophagaceae bacterium]
MDQVYTFTKDIHSYWRWIILALAVIVLIKYLYGWFGKQKFTSTDNRLNLFFVTALDIQLLIGLALYIFLSPVTKAAFQSGESIMANPGYRFSVVEHPITMLLAIILAHVGRVMVKRSTTDVVKFKKGAIFFGLSLLFILSRMPW